jgi:hypothetical protein
MDAFTITCPYCWQQIDIEAPFPSATPVEFVTDCEVCCRPIRVVATWDAEDLEDSYAEPTLTVEAEAGD